MRMWMLAVVAALALPAVSRSADDPYTTALDDFLKMSRQTTESPGAADGSLFNSSAPSLYEDFKARRVNDIITIVVSESTTATNQADATHTRDSKMGLGITSLFGIETHVPASTGIDMSNLAAAESKSAFAGTGTTTRKGIITTTMSARVKEVFPNGNLLIEGVRELTVNSEKQLLLVTGVVRPRDITTNNRVASEAIADLQIKYTGKGDVNNHLRPGMLYRILQAIWPF